MGKQRRGQTVGYQHINIPFTREEYDVIASKMPLGAAKATFLRLIVFEHFGIDPQEINQHAQAA